LVGRVFDPVVSPAIAVLLWPCRKSCLDAAVSRRDRVPDDGNLQHSGACTTCVLKTELIPRPIVAEILPSRLPAPELGNK